MAYETCTNMVMFYVFMRGLKHLLDSELICSLNMTELEP